MSGKPNPEGVRHLREAVRRMKKANDRIEILTTQMENCVAELKVQRDIIEAGKKILFGEMAAIYAGAWQEYTNLLASQKVL